MARPRVPGKYAALVAYLKALPADRGSVELSFAEIEAFLGEPLPRGAWTVDFWVSSATAQRYWRGASWRARLNRLGRSVAFTRTQES